jgi:hypothetical protein
VRCRSGISMFEIHLPVDRDATLASRGAIVARCGVVVVGAARVVCQDETRCALVELQHDIYASSGRGLLCFAISATRCTLPRVVLRLQDDPGVFFVFSAAPAATSGLCTPPTVPTTYERRARQVRVKR